MNKEQRRLWRRLVLTAHRVWRSRRQCLDSCWDLPRRTAE